MDITVAWIVIGIVVVGIILMCIMPDDGVDVLEGRTVKPPEETEDRS